MNKHLSILSLFLAINSFPVFGQVVTGNIIDGLDKNFLDKVWVINLQTKDSSLTNERGYFRVFGNKGDSLLISRNYYIPKTVIVGEDKHFLTEIYLDARTLPRFDLYSERTSIPFNLGNMSNLRPISNRSSGPGKIYGGTSEQNGMMPGLTLDGPISYFMRSERQKREYARKMAIKERQKDYLDLIQSDSIMQALKIEYNLTERDLDDLIVEFNLQNLDHQFLDLNSEKVYEMLTDFLNQRTKYRKEDIQNEHIKSQDFRKRRGN
ncbi:hypothetical protein [Cecembia rubra]|uniref:hypothetical protein n=1 Tax=Cecembia rubra TaxID=1485585 RepID=UPI002715525C|nr:hypothetical protein [Cecembia rubra]